MLHNQAITDSKTVAQAVAAPGAGAVIVTTGVLPAGVYRVEVVVQNAATAETSAAGLFNMALRKGSTVLGALPSTSQPTRVVVARVTIDGTQSISVVTTAAAIAGSMYVATVSATRLAA